MKAKKKKTLNRILLLASIALFIYVLFLFGSEALEIIRLNVNFFFLGLVILIALLSFVPYTMRFKVILEAYHDKVPLWMLFKHTLAAFAVSYVTPFSRIGGEPIRIYMLKKEAGVDYKTGSTAVILDKYVEVLGGVFYLVAGLVVVMALPNAQLYLKVILGAVLLASLIVLGTIYIRGKNNKGYFSSFFRLFRLHKLKKISHWLEVIVDVETRMNKFFKHHKKRFFLSFFYYLVTSVIYIALMKVLLLSIGIDFPIHIIVLVIVVWGVLNTVPTPAGLGALEAGQSALFGILRGNASMGLAMTLILRFGYLTVVGLGFIFLSQFSRRQLKKDKAELFDKKFNWGRPDE